MAMPLFTEMLRLVKVPGQATLLAYLIREGAHPAPLRRSTRSIETDLATWRLVKRQVAAQLKRSLSLCRRLFAVLLYAIIKQSP
ncbi:hypothetical protein UB46_41760 [Burkholderiaceae bacterium 16]|nr:hypothetical protein UB46_41760 [Burkholderiaceae bacterium 16]